MFYESSFLFILDYTNYLQLVNSISSVSLQIITMILTKTSSVFIFKKCLPLRLNILHLFWIVGIYFGNFLPKMTFNILTYLHRFFGINEIYCYPVFACKINNSNCKSNHILHLFQIIYRNVLCVQFYVGMSRNQPYPLHLSAYQS